MPSSLRCESRIERVVVYARGAMIARRILLPAEVPSGALDLVVPGLSPLAEPGAFRADTFGARLVLGVRPRLVVPERPDGGGEAREKVRALERAAQALQSRRAETLARRESLLGLAPRPALNGRSRKADPAGRFGDAVAVSALADELARSLDAELEKLQAELEANTRAAAAARLEAEQASSRARLAPGHPSWEVTLHLADGGPVSRIELTYPVPAARWWPAYSARVAAGAGSAELALEAFVAQASLEDWTGVRIGLCTADMAADARLPELSSLRLGRAQPPRRPGFRPPPEGLEALFAGYDRTMRGLPPPSAAPPVTVTEEIEIPSNLPYDEPAEEPEPSTDLLRVDALAEQDEAPAKDLRELRKAMPRRPPAPAAAPPPPPAAKAMVPLSAAAPMPQATGAPMMQAPGRRSAPSGMVAGMAAEVGGGGFGAAAAPEPEIDTDTWLDYDALALPPVEAARRGRLTRGSAADRRPLLNHALVQVESASPPGGALDPLRSRGEFDHRFDAEGVVDVPSNGLPHRVTLAAAQAPTRARFRTVPREGAEVYREAVLTNPFPAPLLGGPVDVFVDGALVATTALSPVGRGGPLTLGLGVEERLRVARNARAEEATKGVFSGTTAVDHRVAVDVASALGREVELEVLERLPVSDDRDVKVTPLEARPPGEAYDQADRGAPLRGGVRFRLKVPAGGKATLTYGYRVELPSKMEVVGGNRRE